MFLLLSPSQGIDRYHFWSSASFNSFMCNPAIFFWEVIMPDLSFSGSNFFFKVIIYFIESYLCFANYLASPRHFSPLSVILIHCINNFPRLFTFLMGSVCLAHGDWHILNRVIQFHLEKQWQDINTVSPVSLDKFPCRKELHKSIVRLWF